MQGGLSLAERTVPGGFQGQWCGAHEVGNNLLLNESGLPRGSFGDVQLFGHCAYASMRDPSNLALESTGTAVLDVRVPSNPVWVRTLRTPAMQRAYSAFEIQKNVMISAFKDFGPSGNNWFDVYELGADCLNPTFRSTSTGSSSRRRPIRRRLLQPHPRLLCQTFERHCSPASRSSWAPSVSHWHSSAGGGRCARSDRCH